MTSESISHTPVDDLDDLDSLLDELEDEVLSKPPGSGIESLTLVEEPLGNDTDPVIATESNLEDDFNKMMQEIGDLDPQLASQLNEFVQELQQGQQSTTNPALDTPQNKNFEDIMSDTINRLKNSGENVDKQIKQEQQQSLDDPISQLLSQLGDLDLDESDTPSGGIGDVLMEMLTQLTSKSVLYEPLKDLHGKFPLWLEEKKSVIPDSEHENYTKQYKFIHEIILKFEDPSYDPKTDATYINDKLEKLQDLGMPPEEIMNSELGSIPGFTGGNNQEFSNDEIPEDLEKQLQEGCKQS